MKSAIVVPCYNEEKRLPANNFIDFLKRNSEYMICFVNDGSTDQTLEVLKEIKYTLPDQVEVHNMPQNSGKAEAVRAGVNSVLRTTNVFDVGFIDADLSTDFDDYLRLADTLRSNRVEMVFGSRRMSTDSTIDREAFRSLASNVAIWMINRVLALPIKDTQCGAKIFTRNSAMHLFRTPFISQWLFDVEIFLRLKMKYGKEKVMSQIKELALLKWVEVDGSKLTMTDALKMPMRLLAIFYGYQIKPIHSPQENTWNIIRNERAPRVGVPRRVTGQNVRRA